MKKTLIIFFILFFLTECNNTNEQENITESKNDIIPNIDEATVYDSISHNIGFIRLSDKMMEMGEPLSLYNLDKSLYKKMSFDKFQADTSFILFAYKPDYYLLIFRCVKSETDFFTVNTNEYQQNNKLIKADTSKYKFMTWEEMVLNCFAVDFDKINNPLRVEMSSVSDIIPYSSDEIYFPVEINGDWLKVKWGTEQNWHFAYIKWRRNNYVLVDIALLC